MEHLFSIDRSLMTWLFLFCFLVFLISPCPFSPWMIFSSILTTCFLIKAKFNTVSKPCFKLETPKKEIKSIWFQWNILRPPHLTLSYYWGIKNCPQKCCPFSHQLTTWKGGKIPGNKLANILTFKMPHVLTGCVLIMQNNRAQFTSSSFHNYISVTVSNLCISSMWHYQECIIW